jgi:Spy/CpxP family protein refolding chaperone
MMKKLIASAFFAAALAFAPVMAQAAAPETPAAEAPMKPKPHHHVMHHHHVVMHHHHVVMHHKHVVHHKMETPAK